jgi:hypothetical protein
MKPINRFILGIILVYLGLSFGLIETYIFGSNFYPESINELICDIGALSMVIVSLSHIIISIKFPNE